MSRPILVGEANPYGGDPRYALYPDPEGTAGHRLCHKVLGVSVKEYLRDFERVNLCPRAWSKKVAEANADLLAHRSDAEDCTLVLLGAKVCSAFGYAFTPFDTCVLAGAGKRSPLTSHPRNPVVILPHPSGLSRAWNEPGAYQRARDHLVARGVLRAAGAVAGGVPENRLRGIVAGTEE